MTLPWPVASHHRGTDGGASGLPLMTMTIEERGHRRVAVDKEGKKLRFTFVSRGLLFSGRSPWPSHALVHFRTLCDCYSFIHILLLLKIRRRSDEKESERKKENEDSTRGRFFGSFHVLSRSREGRTENASPPQRVPGVKARPRRRARVI